MSYRSVVIHCNSVIALPAAAAGKRHRCCAKIQLVPDRNELLIRRSRLRGISLHGVNWSFQMLRAVGAVCACSSVVLVLACRPAGGIVATYGSPHDVYTVQLAGKSTAPKAMFVEHLLYASVFKGPTVVVRKWEIHFADMLDIGFD
jgi:hypothetical protein